MDNIKVVVSPVIKQDGRQKIFISFMIDRYIRTQEHLYQPFQFLILQCRRRTG